MEMPDQKSFGEKIHSHENNFNLVRLSLAILVMFYHAFVLNTLRANALDPLSEILSGLANTNSGEIAVDIFFVISGIFVTQSWLRDPDLFRFAIRRFARIVPGLFICVTLTTLIAVLFFSKQGWRGLLELPPWQFVFENSLLHRLRKVTAPEEWEIPGVYYNLNIRLLNGSLWTLVWEGRFYVFLGLTGAAALITPRQWFVGIAIFCLLVAQLHPELIAGFLWEPRLLSFFMSGVLVQCLAHQMTIKGRHIGCVIAYSFLFYKSAEFFTIALLFGVIALWIGGIQKALIPHIQRHDYSFGVYIYHWPIMQMLRMELSPIGPIPLFFAAMPLVLSLSVLSWHYVERPATKFAQRIMNFNRSPGCQRKRFAKLNLFEERFGAATDIWPMTLWKRRQDEAPLTGAGPIAAERSRSMRS
jgi:peptidoglycan/LPS O-acetylase OafA/YrhL